MRAHHWLLAAALWLAAEGARQPHIVFVLVDDLGWNDVGYHGSEIETPHLDELAAAGVTMDSYYVQPLGSPSRSQLMTGRYQTQLGTVHDGMQFGQPIGVPLNTPTLADRLRDAGYATHAVGKWHLGMYTPNFLPTRRGFDSFYGQLGGAADHFNHSYCIMAGDASTTRSCGLDLRDNEDLVLGVNEYSTDLYTRKAVEVVNEHDATKPLFLYLAYDTPHVPLQVPPDYENAYPQISDPIRRTYAGMVTYLDESIRRVTTAMKEREIWRETLFIFSSDNGGDELHGGASNAPLRGEKGCLFEGGIRVPGFLHGARLSRMAGTVNQDLVHLTDWFPTLVNLANGDTSGLNLDGYDIWKTISRGHKSPRTEILHDLDILTKKKGQDLYPASGFDTRLRAAIRVDDWKLITGRPDASGNQISSTGPTGSNASGSSGSREATSNPTSFEVPRAPTDEAVDKNIWLFNITKDPYETRDLSADYPDVVEKLLRRLSEHAYTAVPPVAPCLDPRANPALHNHTWGPWLEAGQESTVEPLCQDFAAAYEEFLAGTDHGRGQQVRGGPGSILIVFLILIFCTLLFGTLFSVSRFYMQRKKQLLLAVNMDHE